MTKIEARMTARQFRACLKKAEVSQRKFALWLGFDVGTVNRWAKGGGKFRAMRPYWPSC